MLPLTVAVHRAEVVPLAIDDRHFGPNLHRRLYAGRRNCRDIDRQDFPAKFALGPGEGRIKRADGSLVRANAVFFINHSDVRKPLPVRIGIPGVLKRRKLIEIALRVGVGDSTRYITKHAGIVARLMRRGDYRPDPLVARLAPVLDDSRNRICGFQAGAEQQPIAVVGERRR